jgi:hypothetical protein
LRLARLKPPGRLLDPVGNCGARGMIATRCATLADDLGAGQAAGTESGLQARSANAF